MCVFGEIDQYKDNIAIISDEGQFTYQEMISHTQALAEALGGRKLIFIICSNSYASLLGYVTCLRNQIVPLMINHSMNVDMVESLIKLYKPAFIWQPTGFMDGKREFELYGYELICCNNVLYPIAEELALLLTTSGSTGSPKYVRQSYSNIRSNALSIIQYLGINSADRAITTLPMSYTYGLSIINTHLIAGASIILTEQPIIKREFWETLKRHKANNFGGVPYTYETLKKLHFDRMDLGCLRYITQAGGKLGKDLHVYFADLCEQKEIEFIVMYGQTEATARMSWLPWDKSMQKAGSIGIAIPGGAFSLIDANNQIIEEDNIVGELIYQGENVTLGYANSYGDLALPDERKGLLETGDMAFRDKDGYYYIAGRKKRFLKIYGNRVNLDELDGMLKMAGYEAVVAGEDNHIKIFAVDGNEQEIISYMAKRTNLNPKVFEVNRIQEIPRTESGKVIYAELK